MREVVGHLQVVIRKFLVLFRIEHLEQRRRGIAPPVRAHLVDLVKHEHRVARTRDLHLLQYAAWHRANVGAPMPPDLGLVVNAAQREPYELPAKRAGNRLAKAGFPDPGRPDETQDRRA